MDIKLTKNRNIDFKISYKSNKLYIFFGGINGRIGGLPPFEFYKVSKTLDASKIYLRDIHQTWYQNGFPNLTNNCYETKNLLQNKIYEINPEETIFVGNSMGGFAAILFALLIGRGKVIAFLPQTFISLPKRIYHGDSRWKTQIYKTYLKSAYKIHVYDLKKLMEKQTNLEQIKINIYASSNNKMDVIHTENISHFDNVKVNLLPFGNHGVIKHLRDQAELDKILQK